MGRGAGSGLQVQKLFDNVDPADLATFCFGSAYVYQASPPLSTRRTCSHSASGLLSPPLSPTSSRSASRKGGTIGAKEERSEHVPPFRDAENQLADSPESASSVKNNGVARQREQRRETEGTASQQLSPTQVSPTPVT